MRKSRKIAIIILFTLSITLLIGTFAMIQAITADANLNKTLLPTPSAVTFYDINDQIIRQDDYARMDEISANIKNAFISVEDKRFYRHHGIDLKRIVGAIVTDIKKGSFRQGGSTITCQLIKNTHLTNNKTIERKLKEAKIALQAEKEYTKDEILEMYLNILYFGNGIYGIKNACTAFFNKSTYEITPREAATLAAIVANPSRYSPKNLEENQLRAEMILTLMKIEGYVSDREYEHSLHEKIILNYGNFNNNYSQIYFNSTLNELKSINSTKFDSHSINVYTYYDPAAQNAAQNAINLYVTEIESPSSTEIIIAENRSGAVIAYANTSDYKPLKRQPGSLLKPFIYATAIQECTLIPATPLLDTPKTFGDYSPQNYNNIHYGWIDAEFALSHSLNVPAVSILNEVGIEKAAFYLERSGIPLNNKDKNLALALGGTTYGSTIPEICEGYMTIANLGTHKELSFIRKITDNNGSVLYRQNVEQNKAFSEESAYLTTSMLRNCAKTGTAKQLCCISFDVAAKTGTVAADKGNSDAWCAGYTTEHTMVCRYSCQSPDSPLPNNVTGANHPTKTIRYAIKTIYKNTTPTGFNRPIGVKTVEIDQTIKNEMHKLVPAQYHSIGKVDQVLTTRGYHFDAIDPDTLFFADLSITQIDHGTYIRCKERKDVEYYAYLNDKACPHTEYGFYAEPQFFPLAKLELLCKKDGKTIYRKTKIIRIGQSLITSTESSAAEIRVS